MRQQRLTTLCLALAAAGILPQVAHAIDGYFANGYGLKSIGMGGAAVAVAQEPFGGAVNPGDAIDHCASRPSAFRNPPDIVEISGE